MSQFEAALAAAGRSLWVEGALDFGIGAAAVAVAFVAHRLLFAALSRVVRRTSGATDDLLLSSVRDPSLLAFAILAVVMVLPSMRLPPGPSEAVERLLVMAVTATIGWLALRLTGVAGQVVERRLGAVDASAEPAARQARTRVRILARIAAGVIVVVTLCLLLMSIPSIRQIGVTLFASAGVAGLVAGIAARPAVSNLIAGVQLALTQPIRLEDSVVVEGEFGQIEEIASTYVVVRTWDQRRLIVPLSVFIEKPFQNWTRDASSNLLGSALFYVDYAVSIDDVRAAAARIVAGCPEWDGKVFNLQVTDARENTLELRVLVSAATASALWDLRVRVREEVVKHLQSQPNALFRMRAQFTLAEGAGVAAAAGAPAGPDAR